jgi:hypothetical protein
MEEDYPGFGGDMPPMRESSAPATSPSQVVGGTLQTPRERMT